MGTRGQDGFTIIETTLFLAVTSLLIVMMVAATGASLNVQRYRDAVDSFKSTIQQQYSDLANVQNGRENNWTCSASSTVTQNGSNDKIRGQSNCFLIGKYIRIQDNDVSVYPVLATQVGTTKYTDIISMIQNYSMNVSQVDVVNSKLDWGTQIAWSNTVGGLDYSASTTPRNLGILFVRSPDSGLIYTFSSDTIQPKPAIGQPTFTNLLVGGVTGSGKQKARTICIESQGLAASSDRGIYIAPYASGVSAVETRSNEYNASIGVATRC